MPKIQRKDLMLKTELDYTASNAAVDLYPNLIYSTHMNKQEIPLIHFEAIRSWFTSKDRHLDNFEKRYPRTYNALMTDDPMSFDLPEYPSEYIMGRLVFEPENCEAILQIYAGCTYEHVVVPDQVYGIISKHGKPYAKVQGYAYQEPGITYL